MTSTPSVPEDKGRQADAPETKAPETQGTAFAIVGIGASAGGLEAASQMLEALAGDTGMAFVLVQHLDPKHESKLDTILAKATPMPVREATHGMKVEPNNLYIIPPNTTMTIAGGVLQLAPRGEPATHRLPVDSFFKSLAADRQSGAIGVILSGTGSDGTLGLEDIKAAGGITFAQDEESARHAGMPLSAVRSGCVDVVLAPAEIARELARIGQHPYVTAPPAVGDRPPQPSDEVSFRRILSLLRSSSGVDFSAYRDTTIRRRIMRRMVLNIKEHLTDYAQHVEQNPSEVEALYQDLLINVTSFFREPEAFEALKEKVFPEILKGKSPGTPIRIWVPGCATGQEAYSLAMALLEFLDDKGVNPGIQVFATDLSDTVSLQKAREGLYSENIEAEVSPARLRRFFTKEDGKYRVSKTIREICLFAKQNVAADPPFSRVDLISCRNLLIYLAPPLQKRVIPTFHYALNPNGFLLLGASETIGAFADLFTLVDRQHRIYVKKASAVRSYPHFAADDISTGGAHGGRRAEGGQIDWQREADRLLLSRYSPPAALIDNDFNVLQFRGETSPYLRPSPGEASLNLLKMAREGLFLELRSAIAEARVRKMEAARKDVRVRGDAEMRTIDLRVLPVSASGKDGESFLVLFEDERAAKPHALPQLGSVRAPAGASAGRVAQWFRRMSEGENVEPSAAAEELDAKTLRHELASTREYLQSVIEEQDAANEELKSANEEILSSNEELQSTNEELETAKEELQSVNEELTTVNDQLQSRNGELSRLSDDVINFLASTNMPMVTVGPDLRIRRATPAAAKLFNFLPTDIGQPIGNLKPAIDLPDLEALIGQVVETVQVREREVRDRDGRHHVLRIHPYRTADNRIDGAVIVLVDIEELTSQAFRLKQKAALINMSSDAIIVRDRNNLITFWNHGAELTYGWTSEEAIGKDSHRLLGVPNASAIDDLLRSQDRWQGELSHTRRDGSKVLVESRHVVERADGGDAVAILEINRDITEQKRVMDELAEADHRKNDFLATLAHELRNPLTPVRNGMQVLRMLGTDSPKVTEARETIERNIRRMTRLIDDLLDVSRITHGQIELRKEPIDVGAMITEVADEFRSMAESAGNEVRTRLPSRPLYVDADPVRLAQIVENLLHNAIKFTGDGGRIEIAVETKDSHAVVRMRDSGIGIAPENLARIWEPFTQGDSSLEKSRSGLGIGLTLVRRLVELHGGEIKATSDGPGKGSEFVVKLPLADGAGRAADVGAQPEESAVHGRRILVVDDNVDAAESFASLLKLMQNDVRTAADGLEALNVAREFRPEIVLLDLAMPGKNGYEVARELRREFGDGKLVIVAVSGYGAAQDKARSAEAGFDAHFVKPMDIDSLRDFLAAREHE